MIGDRNKVYLGARTPIKCTQSVIRKRGLVTFILANLNLEVWAGTKLKFCRQMSSLARLLKRLRREHVLAWRLFKEIAAP